MIGDGTVRIYWKRCADYEPRFEDGNIAHALQLRKEFILSDLEYKIVIMKQKKWVTIAESKGWEE